MTFVRTVLGDIDPAELGACDAHEHLVIDGGRPVELEPDFLLADVGKAIVELDEARAAGLRSVVDAMPCDAGRNVRKLAEISRCTGIHVIAPTGLHLSGYYDDLHWCRSASVEELTGLFISDVRDGIDERDYSGPLVRRTEHRAGVIKVAGSRDGLSALEQKVFEAAAAAHVATGVPILTHATDGLAGPEQVRFLVERGVDAAHVVVSHVDKVVDEGYQRELLATGATLEYDQSFRWPAAAPNGTLDLLEALVPDFPDQFVLGMDAARQKYWRAYGGRPGLAFLLGEFSDRLEERGIDLAMRTRIFVSTPARVFSFAPVTA
ncbi:MAG TPA: hypothetical protein VIV06_06450 [Candidatus Limnocylindrales bacterium]